MKKLLMGIVMAVCVLAGGLYPVEVLAAGNVCDMDDADVLGCNDTKNAGDVAGGVIGVVLSLVGVVAVGVMIYGGVSYMISQGDPGKTKRARDIILYGLIGFVITILAYVIVKFVVDEIG